MLEECAGWAVRGDWVELAMQVLLGMPAARCGAASSDAHVACVASCRLLIVTIGLCGRCVDSGGVVDSPHDG